MSTAFPENLAGAADFHGVMLKRHTAPLSSHSHGIGHIRARTLLDTQWLVSHRRMRAGAAR